MVIENRIYLSQWNKKKRLQQDTRCFDVSEFQTSLGNRNYYRIHEHARNESNTLLHSRKADDSVYCLLKLSYHVRVVAFRVEETFVILCGIYWCSSQGDSARS